MAGVEEGEGGLKVLPVSWFGALARIFTKIKNTGVWLDGLLNVYIATIPKIDGDASRRGQRGLSMFVRLFTAFWACARMGQLEERFRSWVPDSVFSA